ncbi:response regulator transcription factor [Promicromonospora sukumoe]|uniref:DNA-binding NarL/FixJ family response regulator n=1 Tax=Promicromonospora sukumoe TaxID=88382 RepID=A0A7W3J6J1_9MICO|nr:response regulator transcription factor [Promicromonospora sukumoe]MBA8807231.1 DNA-binding NarL/FixJ family response regulator [Promicromonospora sukumoe]
MTAQDRAPVRVLTADDQKVVREGLALLLGLLPGVEVVGAAEDGEQAVRLVAELAPDVVLMDLRMPRCDGVEATRRIVASGATTKVLVLTTFADDRSVIGALQAGAAGYLTKDAGADEIRSALFRVVDGDAALDPAVQRHLVAAISRQPPPPGSEPPPAPFSVPPSVLTPRESEVLRLIALGQSNAEIAAELVISEGTVKSHITHILTKIEARDRAHAVSYAFRTGLLDPGTPMNPEHR